MYTVQLLLATVSRKYFFTNKHVFFYSIFPVIVFSVIALQFKWICVLWYFICFNRTRVQISSVIEGSLPEVAHLWAWEHLRVPVCGAPEGGGRGGWAPTPPHRHQLVPQPRGAVAEAGEVWIVTAENFGLLFYIEIDNFLKTYWLFNGQEEIHFSTMMGMTTVWFSTQKEKTR